MDNELVFRKLRADEIDVRIGSCTKGGVSLLLYKDARCDQNILDETVGPMNWQRHHTRDNANCIVSIRNSETGEWIEKEDTGVESNTEKEKGLASDSFKRACFNWGLGRELYTAPRIFIGKDRLKNFREEGGKYKCYDMFSVKSIEYVGSQIKDVVISVSEYGKEYAAFKFSNDVSFTATSAAPKTATPEPAPANTPKTTTPTSGMAEDEVILIGNCKGKVYGEVKDTDVFKSFLRWVVNANTAYPDPKQQEQYLRLKALAQKVLAPAS